MKKILFALICFCFPFLAHAVGSEIDVKIFTPDSDPVTMLPIPIRIQFSEPVYGFDPADIVIVTQGELQNSQGLDLSNYEVGNNTISKADATNLAQEGASIDSQHLTIRRMERLSSTEYMLRVHFRTDGSVYSSKAVDGLIAFLVPEKVTGNANGQNRQSNLVVVDFQPNCDAVGMRENEYCIQLSEQIGPNVVLRGETGLDLFGNFMVMIYRYTASILGIIVVLVLVAGGLMIILGGADSEMVNTAKSIITKAVLSLILLFLTGLILRTVNPAFFETHECQDGVDNDGDGLLDERDPGCQSGYESSAWRRSVQSLFAQSFSGEKYDLYEARVDPECGDMIDNDGDGFIDADDSDCKRGGLYDRTILVEGEGTDDSQCTGGSCPTNSTCSGGSCSTDDNECDGGVCPMDNDTEEEEEAEEAAEETDGPDDDGDGVSNESDSCPETAQNDVVDAEGCSCSQKLAVSDQPYSCTGDSSSNPFCGDVDGVATCMLYPTFTIHLSGTTGQKGYDIRRDEKKVRRVFSEKLREITIDHSHNTQTSDNRESYLFVRMKKEFQTKDTQEKHFSSEVSNKLFEVGQAVAAQIDGISIGMFDKLSESGEYTFEVIGDGYDDSSGVTDAEKSTLINEHNKYRRQEGQGLPGLQWNDSMAAYAQEWAEHLEQNNNCSIRPNGHRSGANKVHRYGENLASGTGGYATPANAVQGWYNEKIDYDYATNSCKPGKMCGHYTQVVWKNTTEFGCGKVECDGGNVIWVCNYNPAGNMTINGVKQRPY